MPVVALAAIDAIMIAVAASLLIWALAYFVNAVAQMIPNWSIPFLGNIRNYVAGAAQDVENVMGHYFHAAIAPLEAVILWPINAVETLFTKIYSAIQNVHNVMAWTVKQLIPAIYAEALTFSVQQAAAVSGDLTTKIVQAIDYTTTAAADAIIAAQQHADTIVNDLHGTLNDVENLLGSQIQSVLSQALQGIAGVENDLTGVENYLGTQIQSVLNQALSGIANLDARVESDIANTLTVSEQFAQNTATAAIGALVTDLDQQLTQDTTAIWSGIQTGISAVDGVINNALPDILSGLRAIPGSIPGSLPAAITASLAISIPILKFMEQCGIPNCKNLSQYGRDLQGVLGLAEDVGFMALFIALATDPTGAADEVANVLGPVLNGAVAAGKELLTI